jgi:hypothetical protein
MKYFILVWSVFPHILKSSREKLKMGVPQTWGLDVELPLLSYENS